MKGNYYHPGTQGRRGRRGRGEFSALISFMSTIVFSALCLCFTFCVICICVIYLCAIIVHVTYV